MANNILYNDPENQIDQTAIDLAVHERKLKNAQEGYSMASQHLNSVMTEKNPDKAVIDGINKFKDEYQKEIDAEQKTIDELNRKLYNERQQQYESDNYNQNNAENNARDEFKLNTEIDPLEEETDRYINSQVFQNFKNNTSLDGIVVNVNNVNAYGSGEEPGPNSNNGKSNTKTLLPLRFSAPNWGVLNWINDRTSFIKQLDSATSEPGLYYFKVFIKFDTSYGLFGGIFSSQYLQSVDSNGNIKEISEFEDINVNNTKMINVTNMNYVNSNSLINYYILCRNFYASEKINHRILALYKFAYLIKHIFEDSPWFIKSVSGLSDADKLFPESYAKERVIDIACNKDSIDMRLMTLMELYKFICFDEVNCKELAPENLRKFDMQIVAFHTPLKYYQTGVKLNGRGQINYKSLNDRDYSNRMSYKMWTFQNCEFKDFSGISSLNSDKPSTFGPTFKIKYDRVYTHVFNEWEQYMFGSDGFHYNKIKDFNNHLLLKQLNAEGAFSNISSGTGENKHAKRIAAISEIHKRIYNYHNKSNDNIVDLCEALTFDLRDVLNSVDPIQEHEDTMELYKGKFDALANSQYNLTNTNNRLLNRSNPFTLSKDMFNGNSDYMTNSEYNSQIDSLTNDINITKNNSANTTSRDNYYTYLASKYGSSSMTADYKYLNNNEYTPNEFKGNLYNNISTSGINYMSDLADNKYTDVNGELVKNLNRNEYYSLLKAKIHSLQNNNITTNDNGGRIFEHGYIIGKRNTDEDVKNKFKDFKQEQTHAEKNYNELLEKYNNVKYDSLEYKMKDVHDSTKRDQLEIKRALQSNFYAQLNTEDNLSKPLLTTGKEAQAKLDIEKINDFKQGHIETTGNSSQNNNGYTGGSRSSVDTTGKTEEFKNGNDNINRGGSRTSNDSTEKLEDFKNGSGITVFDQDGNRNNRKTNSTLFNS